MSDIKIGVIGGSGLYKMEDMANVEEIAISTPFGDPSDKFVIGTLSGQRVAFLPPGQYLGNEKPGCKIHHRRQCVRQLT